MNLFNYESKFIQILNMFADMVILNLLYLLCCIPVFTIGAAQAGLYTALRVLVDKENDEYCYKAFFRGFANGFKKISLLWMGFLAVIAALVWSLLMIQGYKFEGSGPAVWIALIAIVILCIYTAVLTSFHSKFDCTAKQLVKNAWFTMLGHPLRSILLGALVWLPAFLFAADPYSFMRLTLIVITMYYSIALLFGNTIMNKHYKHLEQLFFPADESDPTEEAEDEE